MNKTIFIVLALVSVVISQTQINTRPIIGIYTEPSEYDEYPPEYYSYIASSYVKFVESAGAQAVSIPFDATTDYLDNLFSMINGIIFPGGDAAFAASDDTDKLFLSNAVYLINKAKNATDNGDFFPIWGTCLGFQLISYIESGFDASVLTYGYSDKGAHTLDNVDQSSRLFRNMTADLLNWVQTFPALYYNHNSGVKPEAFLRNPVLGGNLKITSTGMNATNSTFVASFESYKYPIYGSQFHSEKNLFEWKVNAPHDFKSDLATQYFLNFFGNLTRANGHSFPGGVQQEGLYLVSQYPVRAINSSSFTSIYVIPNFQYIKTNNLTNTSQYSQKSYVEDNLRKFIGDF